MPSLKKNIELFKWYYFFSAMWPMSALAIIYFKDVTQSYATAMAVWSLCSLAQTSMEIPTGILTDRIGRRKTLILVSLSIFLSFILWGISGLTHSIFALFMGAILYGTSAAMNSGTIEALIYETVKELKQETEYNVIYSKSNVYAQFGLSIGALLAILISYFFSLSTLAWISVIPTLIQIIISYQFLEAKKYALHKKAVSFGGFIISSRYFLRNKRLRFYAIVRVFEGSLESTIHRFESAYFAELISNWIISFIRFLKQIFGMIGFSLVCKIKNIQSSKIYFSSMSLNVLVRGIAVTINNILSPFLMAFVNIFYGPTMASSSDIMQREYSTFHRATMQSLISFAQGIFTAILLYLFGVIADFSSAHISIAIAIILKIFLLIYAYVKLKK